MPSKYTWKTADGLTRYGGPRSAETDAQEKAVDKEIGKLVPNNGTPIYQDPSTGALIGTEGALLDFSSRGVSSVTYDTSSRVTSFSLGGHNYNITYTEEAIVINGPRQVSAALDPNGRITAVI